MPAEQHQRWTPVVVGGAPLRHRDVAPGDRAEQATAEDPPVGPLTQGPSETTAGAVAHQALHSSVERYLQYEGALVTSSDIEIIHQARVATRRLRSDLRTFRPLFLRAWADDLRSELGVLARSLGAVRDADVLHERLTRRVASLAPVDRPAAAVIVDRANVERERARDALAALLATSEYASIRTDVVRAAHAPLYSQRASRPADTEIRALVRRSWKQVRRDVRALGSRPGDDALHDTRIAVKRCRYAAEAAVPVLGTAATDFAKALRRLQGRLGDHQDAVTAEAWLRGVAGFLDAPSAFVAGELVAIERAVLVESRTRWRTAWKTVRRTRLR